MTRDKAFRSLFVHAEIALYDLYCREAPADRAESMEGHIAGVIEQTTIELIAAMQSLRNSYETWLSDDEEITGRPLGETPGQYYHLADIQNCGGNHAKADSK